MNSSANAMIREMLVLFAIGVAAEKLKPSTKDIRKSIKTNIKTGKQILEFIGDIPEWANYESNLNAYVDSLRSKKTQLRCMESDLNDEVEIIELQTNGNRKREVSNWLRNVRAKASDVSTAEEEMERKNYVLKFLFRAWLGKRLKMEEEEVNDLIKQRQDLGSGPRLVLEPSNGTIQHRLVTSALVGRASSQKRLSIWTTLFKRTTRKLGVHGKPGMGKTTMMANIYNLEVAYSGVFERAFYVNITEGVDLYQLQAAIGEAMNLRDLKNIIDANRRAARIQEALGSCGKFLLILDGLCEYFRLTDVGIPVEEDGGKLVVVSRSLSVCRMACKELVRLENLPEEDSKVLFMKTLGTSADQLSSGIAEVAMEIVRKCGGVPRKIVDTAELLRFVDDIHEWRARLSELE